MSKGLRRIPNVFFIGLLFVPMLGLMTGVGRSDLETFAATEQRMPASFPSMEWTRAGTAALPKKLDQWFSDRFGFRHFLIVLNGLLDVRVLKVSPDPERIVLGKDDWMFLGDQYEHVFSKHCGRKTVSEEILRRFVEERREAAEWLFRQGIGYLVVVTPDKHTIYPEFLPQWVPLPCPSSAADRAVELLAENGVTTLDLRPILAAAKKDYGDVLFRKTDTHWTDLGAYIAYRHIMKGMEPFLGPLKTLEMKTFTIEHCAFPGDLSKMAGVEGYVRDYKVLIDYRQPFNPVRACEVGDRTPPKLLWEDPKKRVLRTLSADVAGTRSLNNFKVVFLRDSFLTPLTHLFNQSFGRCIYTDLTWQRVATMKDLVDRYRPHMVVFQIVERKVPDYKPEFRGM